MGVLASIKQKNKEIVIEIPPLVRGGIFINVLLLNLVMIPIYNGARTASNHKHKTDNKFYFIDTHALNMAHQGGLE